MQHHKTALAAALGLAVFAGSAHAAGTDLFGTATAKATRSAKDSSLLQHAQSDAKVERLAVNTLRAPLSAKTAELNLNLLPGVSFSARLKEAKQTADGSLIWVGKPNADLTLRQGVDAGADSAILVQRQGRITGNVVVGGQLYTIRPLENGEHIVTQVDESRFPPEHPEQEYSELVSSARLRDSLTVAATSRADATSNLVTAAANTTIKLMVNWTQGAAAQVADMTALINLAMTETNQGYANSGIAITAELAHSSAVSYTESSSISTDKDRYAATNDGYMDGIHTLRDQYGADVSLLILNNSEACGIAKAIGATASTAFAVVHYDCATGYYSFAHEMGHLQSARHDPANDPTTTPFAYGHGYQAANKAWRSVMAYNCSPSCTRINYWSNPLKTYTDGQVMGTSTKSDNVRVLNGTATTIAGFRGDVPPPPSGATFTNTTDYAIPDNNTTGVSSPVTSTRTGASGTVSVAVNIVHPYIGDLIVDLIAPSGTVYNLHNRSGGSADNIVKTYSVNAGTTAANGTWKLRVKDRAAADVGYINSWSITFP